MNEFNEKYEEEINRIINLLNNVGINDNKLSVLIPIIENTSWMKVKLDDSRTAVEDSQIVIEYDNGGGQKGLRENPMFKGYEALWKSYMTGMQKIIDCIPDEYNNLKTEEIEKPKTMLEIVRSRKNA